MKHDAHDVRGPMVNVSQSEFEQVMADALEAHPLVTLHWGAAVTGLTQDGDEATVDLQTRRAAHPARRSGSSPRTADAARCATSSAWGCRARATRAATSSPTSTGQPSFPPSGWSGSTRRATPARRSSCTGSPMTSGASTTSSTPPRTPRSRRARSGSGPASPATWPGSGTTAPGRWNGTASTRRTPWPSTASSTTACCSRATPPTSCPSSASAGSTPAWRTPRRSPGCCRRAVMPARIALCCRPTRPSGTTPGGRTSPTPASRR